MVCDKRDFLCNTTPPTCSYGGVCGAGVLPLNISQITPPLPPPPPRQPVITLQGPDVITMQQFEPYSRCAGPLSRFCDLGATAIDAYDMSDITAMVVACADKAPNGTVSVCAWLSACSLLFRGNLLCLRATCFVLRLVACCLSLLLQYL